VKFQARGFARSWFESDDAAIVSELMSGDKTIGAEVCANVEESHLWLESAPEKAEIACVVAPVIEEFAVGIMIGDETRPPKTEGELFRKGEPDRYRKVRNLGESLAKTKLRGEAKPRPRLCRDGAGAARQHSFLF
jgi:hypothetical protein